MKTLDLTKHDIYTFERADEAEASLGMWEQDIIRSWKFLQMTHTLEGRENMPCLYSHDKYECNYNASRYGRGYDRNNGMDEWKFYDSMPDNEAVCIRALVDHKKTNRACGNREHVIKSFDDAGFALYRNFIKKCLFHRDAVYNFFHNIYKMDYVKGQCFQRETGRKMIGRIDNATSTNLLAVDLDAYSFEEYKEIRKLFIEKDIIPIEVSSGHGFHILIKIETCTDSELLAKWLKILSDCGVDVDQHCKDPGRVYRLPFFYNIKSNKYDTVVKAEIMEGEYGVPTYTMEDVFNRFGYDYQTWDKQTWDKQTCNKQTCNKQTLNSICGNSICGNKQNWNSLHGANSQDEADSAVEADSTVAGINKIEEKDGNASAPDNVSGSVSGGAKVKTSATPKKKTYASLQQQKIVADAELVGLYPILDTTILPEGIRNMLKGFVEGYTYYQLMCIVLFFKRSQYSLEQIKDIVSVVESINGNAWNSWDALDMAEYFYDNIYGINENELDSLEKEFGSIAFPAYGSGLKVPLGIMKPNELKLYLYLLRHGVSRKKDIISFLHISANRLDRILKSAVLVKKDGLQYSIMEKKAKNYIYLSE